VSRRTKPPFEEGHVVVQNYSTPPFPVDAPLIVLRVRRVYDAGRTTLRWRAYVSMSRTPKGWLLPPKGWLPAETLSRL
jgi:hypothetical protein